jgi:NADH-quinone oxidoreductase subunit F
VKSPCQSACPAHVDVPGFVSLIKEKRYGEALKLHRERNPFAAVCARVCFHVCEDKCRRKTLDEAVSIRALKRFMVDQEITVQLPEIRENAVNAKRKVAIIGAGPSGLSAGYFLARLGYKPVVFESESRPGGMLIQTIPSYRLPRETLAREIRMIENMGVEIHLDSKLGRDFTMKSLKEEGYEAIYIAIGASKGIGMDLPGKDAKGVMTAMNFLRMYNQRGTVPIGKKMVVVGGGNAAFDAARTAIRLGTESVTIVYRRSQEDMPAYFEEIDEALLEGITLMPLTNPAEIVVEEGRIKGVRCNPMKLGSFDRTGRRKAIVEKESFFIEANQVILAIGQDIADLDENGGLNLEFVDNSYVKIDPINQQTSIPWIFAGGDTADSNGPRTVIEAVAAGERAAAGMDEFLTGTNHAFWREEKKTVTSYDPDAAPVMYARERLELIPVERRRNNFNEVEMSWTENEAIRQAQRCLRCDYGK